MSMIDSLHREMTMAVRTLLVVTGVLVAGGASAADNFKITGAKLASNRAGTLTCSGGCRIGFLSREGIKVLGAPFGADLTYALAGDSLVIDSNGNHFEFEGGAKLQTLPNGGLEARSERIRVTRTHQRQNVSYPKGPGAKSTGSSLMDRGLIVDPPVWRPQPAE
jgi:hypothetical protein